MPKKNKKKGTRIKKITKKIKKLKFSLSDVIVIFIISIVLGAVIGGVITYGSTHFDVSNTSTELNEFINTYESISASYYKKVDKKKIIDAAIEGMIKSLDDPHSNYLDENTTEVFNQTVAGEYVGIGISLKVQDGKAKIVSVFDNSSAKKVGLKVGDLVIKVGNTDISGKNIDEISKLVGGKKNTTVKITVLRNSKEKEYKLKRTSVDIPSVTSKVLEKNNVKVGYIKIDVFSAHTYNQFKKELNKLEKKKIKSLIIDVRSNSGGHLTQVTKILELFIDKKKVLYQVENQKSKMKIYSTTKEKRTYPVAVLINNYSASASEILASAFKETYNSEIVGEKSYGKGTVQKAYELSDGTSLKYTTQKWLTPKGNWINGKGVIPTKEVKLSTEYIENPSDDADNQLQEALELITK